MEGDGSWICGLVVVVVEVWRGLHISVVGSGVGVVVDVGGDGGSRQQSPQAEYNRRAVG
jgi:hypothetical protein